QLHRIQSNLPRKIQKRPVIKKKKKNGGNKWNKPKGPKTQERKTKTQKKKREALQVSTKTLSGPSDRNVQKPTSSTKKKLLYFSLSTFPNFPSLEKRDFRGGHGMEGGMEDEDDDDDDDDGSFPPLAS
ncbi:hypothetical protein PanWU01x14_098870, partial [Parasponia andersonii]